MMTLANLHRFREKGFEVTVVQPSPYHYYSGMGPGMLGGIYSPDEIRFATRHVVEKQDCTFLLDKVSAIKPGERLVLLESGDTLPYDVLSLNIGSSVPREIIGSPTADTIFTVKPIERLLQARQLILEQGRERPLSIAVVGGGPSGVEIAGNIWGLADRNGLQPVTIQIFARSVIMSGFPEKVRHKAIKSLQARGIEIVELSEVAAIRKNEIELCSRTKYETDVTFLASGVQPSRLIAESGLPTGPDGGLLVNSRLQCVTHPEIFGGGDCIYFKDHPLDKVGVYAVRQNPVLLHNLMAFMEGKELRPFDPGGDYLLIFNLGNHTGILRKKCLLFNGRPAFFIKDFIDRRFMKKFQQMER